MKVEVIRPVKPATKVIIEVTEDVAHIVRLSMGLTITGHLYMDPASEEHYALFLALGRQLGENPYKAEKDPNGNIRIERK